MQDIKPDAVDTEMRMAQHLPSWNSQLQEGDRHKLLSYSVERVRPEEVLEGSKDKVLLHGLILTSRAWEWARFMR